MSQGMSDDQVASELKKMTAFIRQEALEKAREIQIKADEEFAIEKSKLVREETSSIDTQYEKKFKQAGMTQQITRSTVQNKSRLRLLGGRQELLDDLFEKARGKLGDYNSGDKYQEIVKNLMLEGLYALNENKVIVRARQADYDVVRRAIGDAQNEFKDKAKHDVTIDIDEKHPVPEGSTGGVTIVGGNGKIEIFNTFEDRLSLLQEDALPQIRATLFGENPNRKFKD